MKRLCLILLAALGMSMLVVPGTAQAGIAQRAQCWIGFDSPVRGEKSKAVYGTGSVQCESGETAAGVPTINERITRMDIEVVLQSRSPATGGWVNRGQARYEYQRGAGLLNVTVGTSCFGSRSTLWRVMISFASAESTSGEEWNWYGEYSRVRELDCG